MHVRCNARFVCDSKRGHTCTFHTKDNTPRHDRTGKSISYHLFERLNRNGIDLIRTAVLLTFRLPFSLRKWHRMHARFVLYISIRLCLSDDRGVSHLCPAYWFFPSHVDVDVVKWRCSVKRFRSWSHPPLSTVWFFLSNEYFPTVKCNSCPITGLYLYMRIFARSDYVSRLLNQKLIIKAKVIIVWWEISFVLKCRCT